MKTAFFRFYEELNDFLPEDKKKTRFQHNFIDRASVKDMIEAIGVPHIEIDLILVNCKSVDFSYLVNDGDDISVYPVFEALDISEIQHLRPKPLRNVKFIVDVQLGNLSKYMRMLGFDTVYKTGCNENEIINISLKEKRTILTKNRELLKRNEVTHGYWVRNKELKQQIGEIINRFDLRNEIKEFTRCMECNNLLEKVEKEKVINRLLEKVKQYQQEFYYCQKCDKIYWKGSHYERMLETIKNIKHKSGE